MPEAGATPSLRPGEVLGGKYRIRRPLGVGGMSLVYEAEHVQLGHSFAIKVLGTSKKRSAFEHALLEAQSSSRLTSEHIVRVLDVGTTESGLAYVVMEKLAGNDLACQLKRVHAFPVQEAVELVLQACHGLAEAHASGIVHRDLKPSNLFLSERADGSPFIKVLDFGLARRDDGVSAVDGTASAVVGSPGYIAPEQVARQSAVDARADIWGLGVILFELVSGRRPFGGSSAREAMLATVSEPTPPLTAPGGELPREFVAVVERCLEKDPDARYASVADLVAALAPFAAPKSTHYVRRIRELSEKVLPSSVPTIRLGGVEGGSLATTSFYSSGSTSLDEPQTTDVVASSLVVGERLRPRRNLLLVGAGLVAAVGAAVGVTLATRTASPTRAVAAAASASSVPAATVSLGAIPPLPAPTSSAALPPSASAVPQAEPPPQKQAAPLPRRPATVPRSAASRPASAPSSNPMTYR